MEATKLKENYNEMLSTLQQISKFMTLKQLQKGSIWLEYEEELEMAYENVISAAKYAKKWKRFI
jgi:hypothetical protein